ncbi:MAG: acetyl-CoA carboxylase biotin carboxyl carrier protein [Geodermatophilaceae bacterium]
MSTGADRAVPAPRPVDAQAPDADSRVEAVCASALRMAATGGLTRLSIRHGEVSVELEWPQPQSAAPSAQAAPASELPACAAPGTTVVVSPMVGTFHRAPEPGAPPFVAEGDRVRGGQQVGIVEAMKLMNPVEADRAGRVVSIEVTDGDSVEYDQPLLVLAFDDTEPK